MAFQLNPREICEKDIIKLTKKYSKKLKKETSIKVLSELFMELIYLFFDNPKRKLYKLFFPVIMVNLIENGSINSIINEYKNTKKLYSESYTCRILKQLNQDTGLEISRVFRKILFRILKRNGFKSRGFCVAVDITAKPFYGNKKLCMVKGTKRKAGTNFAMQYLTASIVEEGARFNLLCFSVSQLTLVDRKVEQMISEIERTISIKLFYLDRGFASRNYCRIIKSLGYKVIMPITKNNKLKELKLSIKEQSEISDEEYTLSELDYIFYEDRPKEYQEDMKLLALYEKKRNKKDPEVFFFITNIYNLESKNYYLLIESYRYRFGIETNYRVDNIFSGFTTSTIPSRRYLLMQMSLIVQDLWTLVNFLTCDKKHQQPREKFKINYSVLAVIKSRTRQLNFIWRPTITAVQFKRQMERVFG